MINGEVHQGTVMRSFPADGGTALSVSNMSETL